MKNHVKRVRLLASLVACEALLWMAAGSAQAALQRPLAADHVPPVVSQLRPSRHADPAQKMHLAISLPMRDPAAWQAFLSDLYDPSSPNYRHFLTPAEIAEQYGPTAESYQAVVDFANKNGLAVVRLHPNRMIVDVEGPVATVEKALHTTINVYQHPTENRTFMAPDTEPTLDVATPVLHVSGLDTYDLPHPNYHRTPRNKKTGAGNAAPQPASGSGAFGTYLGNDIRPAYMPGETLEGAGQKVALVEFDGYFAGDIIAYEQASGLPQVPLTNVLVDAFNAGPGPANTEVALDIDMAVAMAPGLSEVMVYEATNANFTTTALDMFNQIASDDLAEQISMSWTSSYFDSAAVNAVFQLYAAEGQSFFGAAGDAGSFVPFIGLLDEDNPYITVVGGTTLFTSGPGGTYISEQVWNWYTEGFGEAGGGGGISPTFPLPTWQAGIANANNLASTQFRNSPDVSLLADNIFIYDNNGTPEPGIGGTSAATPLWAGFMAMVNEECAKNHTAPIGFANPSIYKIGKSPFYESLFHDITVGNNTNFSSGPVDYPAVVGYDLASGWGTPTPSLIDQLAPKPVAPILQPYSNNVTGGNGNGKIDPNECNEVLVTITNAGSVQATGVEGVLVSETYPGVSVGQSVVQFPDVPPFTAVTARAPFSVSSQPDLPCGVPVHFNLTLKSDQVTSSNEIIFTNGVLASPDTLTWAPPPGAQPPTIPISFSNGLATSVQVDGLQTLGKVTVSVDITSLYDAGLTMQLISPNGTVVTLASGDGGNGADFGLACDGSASCTFDDASPVPIGEGIPPFVGSYAPQEPLSVLSYISGADLNGTWTLNILDEFPGDTATLNCWSLTLLPYVCPPAPGPCSGSDLGITITPSAPVAVANSNFVWTVVATNSGTSDASEVVVQLNNTIATYFTPGAVLSQGTLSIDPTGTNASWSLGSLAVGSTATSSIVVQPTVQTEPGQPPLTTTVSIGSPGTDPNLNNNTASASVLVERPGADLGVTISGGPNPVLENGRLSYNIVVTNNGPFTAKQVVLTTLIPNVNFIAGSTSQGTLSPNGSQAQLGDIPAGSGATITLLVSPAAVGFVTATATVTESLTEQDPVQSNNSASLTTAVSASADLGVSAVATPTSTIAGSNITYTAVITNVGPADATDVTFTHFFPAGARFVSTSISGTTVSTNVSTNTTVHSLVWNIGNLSYQGSVSVTTILAAPTNVGPSAPPVLSSFTVIGQPGDPNTNNNVVNITTINSNAFVSVVPAGMTLVSGATLHPGETGVAVDFVLKNAGNVPVSGLTATLLAQDGILSPSPSGPQSFGIGGALGAGGLATNRFTFNVDPNAGTTVTAVLDLQANGTPLGTASYAFTMPVLASFSNTNFISIPDQQFIPLPDDGPANPYPATVAVSNIVGLIGQVTVTVSNLTHSNPNDISMLLVGPTGLKTVLMSSNALGSSVSGATVTFTPDPSAPLLPQFGSIVSGSYQPTDYSAPAYFPAPAPVGPYTANLSVFDGPAAAANGVWSLYVYDAGQGDSGSIGNGWSLSVETITPVNQTADLTIGGLVASNQLTLGSQNTYTLLVTNAGPNATTVVVTNSLSSGLTYVSSSLPVVTSGGVNVFDLGTMQPGAGVRFTETVRVTAPGAGPETNTFGVYSADSTVYDPIPANNVVSFVTGGELPVADVVALATPPTLSVQGESNVYTLVVSNAGPQLAKSVVGTFTLNGLTNISALPTTAAISGGKVTYGFGDLPPGNVATLQITAAPLNVGVLSNAWVVSTVSQDMNPANNTNWVVVTNESPAPIIVGGPLILLTPTTNGAINPGQMVTVGLVLSNIGYAPTADLVATPQANPEIMPANFLITHYGVLAVGASLYRTFTWVVNAAPGAAVSAVWALSDDVTGASYGNVTNTFVLPGAYSYSNPGAIVIPDVGPASPYPSTITVTNQGSVVTKVTATVHGFTHTFPRDVNVLLQGPGGQTALLMAHAGGPYAIGSGVTLTFDDSSTNELPTTLLTSGTFEGTAYPPIEALPGFSVPTYNTSLSVFDGTSAAGNWNLYVDDDTAGNNGIISLGWSLDVSVANPINPISHLAMTVSNVPSPAFVGEPTTYYITVTNRGPGDALVSSVTTAVTPTNAVIGPVSLPASQVSQGNNGTLVFNLGTIPAASATSFSMQVTPESIGFLTNTLTASTASIDPFAPAPQSITDTTTVIGGAKWTASLSGNSVQLTLAAGASQTFVVQTSTNLVNWTTVSTNTAGADGTITVTDQTTNAPSKFYRALYAPQ